MVFANPVAASLVSGQYYDDRAPTYYLSPDKLQSDYAPVRFQRELRLFRRFCRHGRVLDVGCSTGGFLFQLRSRWPKDYDVLGTDVASGALEYAASRGVPVQHGGFLEGGFGGEPFDAVTFWAVIEHLVEPRAFLHRAATLLRPGGCGFILVPNLDSLAVRFLGGRYRYLLPEHVNYFTPRTLRRFAANEPAFEEISLLSTHFNPVVIWQDWRGSATVAADAERARLLRRTIAWKMSGWLAPVRFCYTAVEQVLGRLRLADNLVIVLRKRPVAPASAGRPVRILCSSSY